MTDTFRALCAELIEAVLSDDSHIDCVQIARRARTLLDQPVAGDCSQISDGYHTFAELYEHRHSLMLALMRATPGLCWFSQRHSEGELPFGSADWFIVGADLPTGAITYHLPIELLPLARQTGAAELAVGRPWDGHTASDVIERLRAWASTSQPPAEGEEAEVAAWLRLFCSEEYESRYLDPDVAWLTRAADLLAQHHPASVPLSVLPHGWYMLCDIEPEPGAMCDWVIMAPWGCDHGSGKWPDYNGVPPREFFNVSVGWPVYYKGFASAGGVMVSDPKLTAWRMLSLPTSETIKD